ncbi:MAG: hypothetical protein JXB23_07070 [Candidatus Aminicenantes bacterium]|nr:hypothetical protein [Candidatus Aminicenantes bacterium]
MDLLPESIAVLCPDLFACMAHLIMRMLAKDPGLRPSIDKLAAALEDT